MIENILEPWNLRTIQEAMQINARLIAKGKTWEDVEKWLDIKKSYTAKAGEARIAKPVRSCPRCGGVLKIFSLKNSELALHPGMKSKWECCKTCKAESCGYTEYLRKDIEQIIKEGVDNGIT